MKKTTVARKLAGLPGFRKSGTYYIGVCNDDVIAGYCLDAPPTSIYVWRFVIPSYDNIDFLHMALGKRVLTLPHTQNGSGDDIDITGFLLRDWVEFSRIRDRIDLISYIDHEALEGTYALWVRYITYIKNRDFIKAEYLLEVEGADEKFLDMPAVRNNFVALSKEREVGDWEGCFALLGAWGHRTKATYCQ